MRRCLFALPLLFGCSHEQPPTDRKISELQTEVTRLQSERDRVAERLASLEVEASRGKETAPQGTGLRVVRISPQPPDLPATEEVSGESAGFTDDAPETPRPVLKVSGGGKRGRSEVQSSFSTEPLPATSRPSALDPDARKAYEDALALFHGRRWSDASNSFTAFLVRWPDHPYASNAMFWRAEVFLAQGDAAHAIAEYEGAIARFPLGNKTPDALLKLAVTLEKQGDKARADAAYARLENEFPLSEATRRIPKRIHRSEAP